MALFTTDLVGCIAITIIDYVDYDEKNCWLIHSDKSTESDNSPSLLNAFYNMYHLDKDKVYDIRLYGGRDQHSLEGKGKELMKLLPNAKIESGISGCDTVYFVGDGFACTNKKNLMQHIKHENLLYIGDNPHTNKDYKRYS